MKWLVVEMTDAEHRLLEALVLVLDGGTMTEEKKRRMARRLMAAGLRTWRSDDPAIRKVVEAEWGRSRLRVIEGGKP